MRTFVALCALLLCLTPVADAQTAAPSAPEIAAPEIAAPEIAATVRRFYGGLTTLELGFTQSYWSDAYGRNLRTSAGTLRIRRPGRLRFDYTSTTRRPPRPARSPRPPDRGEPCRPSTPVQGRPHKIWTGS